MSKKSDYLEILEAAIRIEHKCEPIHKGTNFVSEKTQDGVTVWEGCVEVFDLAGHREFRTCFAWPDTAGGKLKIFAIPESQFIDSPAKAVQSALFMGAQPLRAGANNLEELRHLLQECKGHLQRMAMKVEDLNAAFEAVRETTARPGRTCL